MTGVFLIPEIGITYVEILISSLCVILILSINSNKRTTIPLVVTIVLLLIVVNRKIIPSVLISEINNIEQEKIPYRSEFGTVVFQKSSEYGIVTVGEYYSRTDSMRQIKNRSLWINHRDMCFSDNFQSEYELGSTTVKFLKENPKVLNLGLGCGFTAMSVIKSRPDVSLVVLEINPVVVEACEEFFSKYNEDIFNQSQVNILIKDGIEYLRENTNEKYDAVIVDIEEPGVIQSSPIYTIEYIQRINSLLNDSGVFSLWAIKGGDKYNEIIYHTVKAVFNYVYMVNHPSSVQVYASQQQLNLPTEFADNWNFIVDKTINTLENRALEKSYSIHEAFLLPDENVFKDKQIEKIIAND